MTRQSRRLFSFAAITLAGVLALSSGLVLAPGPVSAASPDVVISQVYGGGGNSGATLTNDFVELYNRGSSPVDVTGWTVQYASSSGVTWQSTQLAGTIPAGSHYLVQEGQGARGAVSLPTPDAVGAIALSATAGKIALSASTTVLSGSCPGGLVDFVGYGSTTNCAETSPAPTLSNTTAALRKNAGATDTDDNAADFVAGAPNPRNLAEHETAPEVTATDPVSGTKNVAPGATLWVTFSEPVTVSAASFDLACSASGAHTLVVDGGPTVFGLDPDTDFTDGDACTLTVLAAGVHDQDAIDPPDTMASNVSVSFSVSADQEGPTVPAPVTSLRSGTTLSGSKLRATVTWGAGDDGSGTGVAGYELDRSTDGGSSWSTVTNGTATSSNVTLASSGTVQFRVRGIDAVGNKGEWAYGPSLAPRLVQQTSSAITYAKTWTKAKSTKFSGRTVKYATAKGAKATYTVKAFSIAFVTTKAASRGKVKVYVDGTLATTLNTYRSTTQYRAQAWARTWASGATHTVKLVVIRKPSGHPRVDLDAFAVLLPASTGVVTGTPAELLASLSTATEDRTGYDRDLFVHWIDADGDGCDTRHEVLIDESETPVTVGGGCSLTGGTWLSAYDGVATSDPADLDIDHMVPLAEAWDSGASGWTTVRRQDFANDLGDPRSLRAVTSSSNSSKSDGDPADWLPPLESFRCTYATEWVAVKTRWRLSVDALERTALEGLLGACPVPQLVVTVP